jgi:hypothetical protein
MPITGKAIMPICVLNPIDAIIHALMVVPILAPKIMPIDSDTESIPAFTKLTVITVTTADACTKAVITSPEKRAFILDDAIKFNMDLSLFPVIFCRLSLINFIP